MIPFINSIPLSSISLAIFNDSPSTVNRMNGSVPDDRINIQPFSKATLIPSTVDFSFNFFYCSIFDLVAAINIFS
jgi:hypothetical protein